MSRICSWNAARTRLKKRSADGNLPAHKISGVREAIETAGARLEFLPPPDHILGRLYSPDFNPIEQAFAQIKACLRKETARTVPDLWTAIANALDAVTPDFAARANSTQIEGNLL